MPTYDCIYEHDGVCNLTGRGCYNNNAECKKYEPIEEEECTP